MGMRENWNLFIVQTRSKGDAHMRVAQYWDMVHNALNLALIFFSALTTVLSVLDDEVPMAVTSAFSGVTTILSAVQAFLQPSSRRQDQLQSAREFHSLLLRMTRCETERVYEDLWNELIKVQISEPFLPKRFVVEDTLTSTITPELLLVITQKEEETKDCNMQYVNNNVDEYNVVEVAQNEEETKDSKMQNLNDDVDEYNFVEVAQKEEESKELKIQNVQNDIDECIGVIAKSDYIPELPTINDLNDLMV